MKIRELSQIIMKVFISNNSLYLMSAIWSEFFSSFSKFSDASYLISKITSNKSSMTPFNLLRNKTNGFYGCTILREMKFIRKQFLGILQITITLFSFQPTQKSLIIHILSMYFLEILSHLISFRLLRMWKCFGATKSFNSTNKIQSR